LHISREELKMRVFENRVFKGIFRTKGEEVTENGETT
jgi:hypothetical protein